MIDPVGVEVHGHFDGRMPQLPLHVYNIGASHNEARREGMPDGMHGAILEFETHKQPAPDPVSKVIGPDHPALA